MSNVIEIVRKSTRTDERLLMLLRGMPCPAWLISEDFRIVEQNGSASEIFGREIGDYCWKGSSKAEKEFFDKHGDTFINEPINDEVVIAGVVWNTCWIPVGDGLFIYYAVNVTDRKRTEKDLTKLSMHDPLTHFYRRNYFMKLLEEQIEISNKRKQEFSLIMLGIDNFKAINEKYGYDATDMVLVQTAAEITKSEVRYNDCVTRWGGREFMIMLPGVTQDRALSLAESIRKRINRISIEHVGGITASIGVTEYSMDESSEDLLERVDFAMHKAEREGRNCVRGIQKKKRETIRS